MELEDDLKRCRLESHSHLKDRRRVVWLLKREKVEPICMKNRERFLLLVRIERRECLTKSSPHRPMGEETKEDLSFSS